MKRTPWIPLVLIVALTLTASCAQTNSSPTTGESTEPEQGSGSSGRVALTFTGNVENDLSLSRADLERMKVVDKTIEHPKDGEQTTTGVTLSTLMEQAQPSDDATLTVTAVDAYSVDVPVADAKACEDCMLAFHDDDSLRLIMPGFGSSFWVKDVVCIEAK